MVSRGNRRFHRGLTPNLLSTATSIRIFEEGRGRGDHRRPLPSTDSEEERSRFSGRNFMEKKIDRVPKESHRIARSKCTGDEGASYSRKCLPLPPDIWLVCPSSSRRNTWRTCPRIRYFLPLSWKDLIGERHLIYRIINRKIILWAYWILVSLSEVLNGDNIGMRIISVFLWIKDFVYIKIVTI